MKAITLYQPWASLLACGAKKFETRSWKTDYRGEIAIHAAAKNIDNTCKAYIGSVVLAAIQACEKVVDILEG